jgi:hypothetical protein
LRVRSTSRRRVVLHLIPMPAALRHSA